MYPLPCSELDTQHYFSNSLASMGGWMESVVDKENTNKNGKEPTKEVRVHTHEAIKV